MAAPHVTGVAALLKAQDATRDWRSIKNLLLASGDTYPALTNTVTGRRLNAYEALSCVGSTVLSPLQPVGKTGTVGVALTVAALHINCADPNGEVTVTVDPGGETVRLSDNGIGADQVAGDGIYSGQWVPTATGTYALLFPNGDKTTVTILSPYTSTSTTFDYRNIQGVSLQLADGSSASVNAPFDIMFGGHAFTTLFVSGNGTINVSTPFLRNGTNEALPTSRIDTLVAPFWDELIAHPGPGAGRNVFWAVMGEAPHRELVIEWRDLEHSLCPGTVVRFEVVFFEGRSDVLFNFATTAFGGKCAALQITADRPQSASRRRAARRHPSASTRRTSPTAPPCSGRRSHHRKS